MLTSLLQIFEFFKTNLATLYIPQYKIADISNSKNQDVIITNRETTAIMAIAAIIPTINKIGDSAKSTDGMLPPLIPSRN